MADDAPKQKDVFLSYGREPEVVYFVQKLKKDLESNGFTVWLDTEDIVSGSDWHGALGTALDNCKAIIPIITKKYINSNFCKGELYMASSDGKDILPVFLEDVDLSANEQTRGVKFIISGVNWTMFRSGFEDYDVSLKKLVQGLSRTGLKKEADSTDTGGIANQMGSLHLTSPPSNPATTAAPSSTSPYQHPPSHYGAGYYPTTGMPPVPPPQPQPYLAKGSSPNNAAPQIRQPYPGSSGPSPNNTTAHPSHLLGTGSSPNNNPGLPPWGTGPSHNNPAYHPGNHNLTSPPYPPGGIGYPPATVMPGFPVAGGYPPSSADPAYPPLPTAPDYPPPPTNPVYPPSSTNPAYPPPTTTSPFGPPQPNIGYPSTPNLPFEQQHHQSSSSAPGVYPYQSPPGTSPYPPAPGYTPYQPPYQPPDFRNEPPPPYKADPEDSTDSAPELPKKEKPKENFKVGMKLEAVDRRFPYFVCVATVMDRSDDDSRVQVHFDGWGPEYNYWCNHGDVELHPAGWCKKHGWELQSPLNQSWVDWSTYLTDTHSEKAPEELFNETQLAGQASLSFESGMKIEAKKRLEASIPSVATIVDVRAGEVRVHFDECGSDSSKDYWCSNYSTEIHPPMWSSKVLKTQVSNPSGGIYFKWSEYLADPNRRPAPAHIFTKDQLSDSAITTNLFDTSSFRKGMRLEAKDRLNPSLVAAATVENIKDGKLLIHFDGWGSRYNYWCEPDCNDIHPVGWCQKSGRQLQPPKGQSQDDFSWSKYLRSVSAVAAPESLFTAAQLKASGDGASYSRFDVGMKLEAVDRKHPSLVCVATVTKVNSNGQLLIHFDGWGPEYDYWCEPTSSDIHSIGWCRKNGCSLQKPKGHHGEFKWENYLASTKAIAAPESLFGQVSYQHASPSKSSGATEFRSGMKLEAVDRQYRSMICVATITDVKDGKLLIHFDGWGTNYDYWCNPSTTDIHPMGWCSKNGVKLHAPHGYGKAFEWNEYLKESKSTAAPEALFKKLQSPGGTQFKKGMKLEAVDRQNPSMTCVATITDVRDGKLLIHFDGWGNNYDYWCNPSTTDIHPMGWCSKKGVYLHAPHGYSKAFEWDQYLAETESVAAPKSYFKQ